MVKVLTLNIFSSRRTDFIDFGLSSLLRKYNPVPQRWLSCLWSCYIRSCDRLQLARRTLEPTYVELQQY